jgi:ferric-dicitrate binding protein FerR (iron transport regulator)
MDLKYLNLIIKELTGEITPVEKEELSNWIPSNKEQYDEVRRIWQRKNENTPVFSTEEGWEEVKRRIEVKKKISGLKSFASLGIAAAVALLVTFSILYINNSENTSAEFNTKSFLSANKVEVIHLPDNSVIWLNKNSRLVLDDNFNVNDRTVRLEGEAFFKIASDKEKPFLIYSSNTGTRVLGTSFNIEAYPGKDVTITVESGEVEFFNVEHAASKLILSASDKAVCYENGGMELTSGTKEEGKGQEKAWNWKDNVQ